MKSFVALITPIRQGHPPVTGGEHPDHTLPEPEQPVDPDYGIDINAPHPDHTLPTPEQPVDPGYGIEVSPPYPDIGLPGPQPHPDHDLPLFPSHPIVVPPGGAWLPIYIWGPSDPRPTPPIVIPEPLPPTDNTPAIEFKAIWTEQTGWVVIGIPTGPHPTPSSPSEE
jgi:hypothetical protein